MTEVPKPVASVAATWAQRFVAPVMRTLAILIGNASAYVSSISTPLSSIKIPRSFFICLFILLLSFYSYSIIIAVSGCSLLYISYCTYNIASANLAGQVLFDPFRIFTAFWHHMVVCIWWSVPCDTVWRCLAACQYPQTQPNGSTCAIFCSSSASLLQFLPSLQFQSQLSPFYAVHAKLYNTIVLISVNYNIYIEYIIFQRTEM